MNLPPNANFLTTRWTRIVGSDSESEDAASRALVLLCESYHYPVYVFIRNRCGDAEKARDLTQGFFELLVDKKFHLDADRARGRFRTFLLGAVKNFLAKEHRDANRLKRGGGQVHLSLDLTHEIGDVELASGVTPDELFDHEWAAAIFDRCWKILEGEYRDLGQEKRYELLRPALTDPGFSLPYAELAVALDTSEGAIKSAVHRMKGRFRELFRAMVAQLVDNPAAVDEEVRYLIRATSHDPYV